MVQNRRFVVASRPKHDPTEENFRLEATEIDLEGGGLKEGEILVKTLWVSIDPYLRAPLGLPGDEARPAAYQLPQFKDNTSITAIGELFGGRGAGVVLKSKNSKVSEGDFVASDWKWQEYAIFNPDGELTFEKLEKDIFTNDNEPGKFRLSIALGALGVSGSHAYFGYTLALHPKAGETMVVSSAAGNIGVIVGQIGKVNGIRSVAIAGGAKANDLVNKKLYDAAIDYKAANNDVATLSRQLKELCPNGIDVYFDNARGFISEAVYQNLNKGARVYVCGGAAEYNNGNPFAPYSNIPQKEDTAIKSGADPVIGKTYLNEIPKARAELVKWARDGKFQFFEHVTEGFENIPKAFIGMYSGRNFGKAVVRL